MAGRPKTRAREAAEAAAAGIPVGTRSPAEVPGVTRLPMHNTHTRAGAGAREPGPRFPERPLGGNARAQLDRHHAEELAALQQQLTPSTTVRIHRLRPSWIAGVAEEYELERGGVSELYDRIKNEWGGELFRIDVLDLDGSVLERAQ